MRSKQVRRLGLILGLLCWVFQIPVLGAEDQQNEALSYIRVRTRNDDKSLRLLNSFQVDCLKLIRAPSMTFTNIEIFRSSIKSRYFLRIAGQANPGTRVDVESNEIWIENKRGQFIRRRYQPEAFQGVNQPGGEFRLTLLVSPEDKLTLPLHFRQNNIEQRYRLVVRVESTGKLHSAFLDPVIDVDMRKKLCSRDHASFALGLEANDYTQSLDSLKGQLSASSQEMNALAVELSLNSNPVLEQRVNLRTLPGQLASGASLNEDISYTGLQLAYHRHNHSATWAFDMGNWVFHPFYRYGIGYQHLPSFKLPKADDLQLAYVDLLNISGGFGTTIYSEKSWKIEGFANIEYPLWVNQNFQYQPIFSAEMSAASTLGDDSFVALNMGLSTISSTYSGVEGLSPSGNQELSQSRFQISLGWLF